MDQPSIRVGTSAILRPWTRDDAPAVMEAFRDPSIQRWHIRRADSIDEALGWLTQWRDGWASESECHWAIAAPETNELLGRIAAKGVNLWDGTAELAYWVTPAARGRGLCTQSVTALSEWAFREAGFHRLELEHSIHNPRSCRVATKAGFSEEGVRRSSARHADGWHDMHVHARLRSDQPSATTRAARASV
ncbi:GNAT family N-acetyltransferase [Rhodococcus enclensis]|nr:GNAT family N-acetyltransferase [Rhodococcus qingshengii]